MTAPISGATQNSQSCPIYSPPANRAGPVLRAGLTEVEVSAGAPELMAGDQPLVRRSLSNVLRLGVYSAARLPGFVETPLALNLQAYATR